MLFVFTMTPASSLFNIVKPVSAAGLTSMSVSPTSNIINELATYSFQFKTATSGTIKSIEISFPSSFDVSGIRLVEREGINSGTLSSTGSTIKYTLGSAQSISVGAFIRLEIARIIATEEGSFTVSIKTLNSQGGTIDGPTTSGPFLIKSITSSDIGDNSITGSDISTGFIRKITLRDDATGNAHGWNPGVGNSFGIQLDDVNDGTSATMYVEGYGTACSTSRIQGDTIQFFCLPNNPPEGSVLKLTVINTQAVECCSATSATISSTTENNLTPKDVTAVSPFDSLGNK